MVAGPGRPRRFCRDSCRQREYEQRRRAGELGLNEDELIITREELELIKDRLFVLQCALEDVDAAEPEDRERVVGELISAARQATGA